MIPLPFNLFSPLTSKIFGGASIGLTLALIIAVGSCKAEHNRAVAYKDALAQTKATYKAAQVAAQAAQDASDAQNAATQAAYNRRLDDAHNALEAARVDGLARYKRLRAETACRAPSGTGAAPVHPDPGAPADGPAHGDLVAARPEDIEAWSRVEVQNAERGEFLRGLVEQGLAVPVKTAADIPEPAFGL